MLVSTAVGPAAEGCGAARHLPHIVGQYLDMVVFEHLFALISGHLLWSRLAHFAASSSAAVLTFVVCVGDIVALASSRHVNPGQLVPV